jgi:NTP pyrophosphatase (non-canonical NTP hydrolase)
MERLQVKIKEFDKARNWDNSWNIKDLCLNMNEEIGEVWHLIKWVDDEKQKEIIKNNYDEAKNFIGDILFLVYKMANQMNVDAEEALEEVLAEYEKRMPTNIMIEKGHANKNAGGYDNKENE